jgi:CrcB protein
MMQIFWICLGGAAGTASRYFATIGLDKLLGTAFPYGTLAVNVLGSFLIGIIMYLGVTAEAISPTVRLALTTGFMGGLTTYSTFSYETVSYFRDGAFGAAAANIFITTVGCLVMCFVGITTARLVVGR